MSMGDVAQMMVSYNAISAGPPQGTVSRDNAQKLACAKQKAHDYTPSRYKTEPRA